MTSQPTQEEIPFVPATQRNNELQLLDDGYDSVLCDAADKLDAASNREYDDGEDTEPKNSSDGGNDPSEETTMNEGDSIGIDFIDFSKWNDNDFEKNNKN